MIKPSLQNDISLAHQRIVKRVVAKAKNATAHPDARSVQTLERFRLTGKGPMFAKLGGSVRYRRCDLDAWIESRLVRSTSQNP